MPPLNQTKSHQTANQRQDQLISKRQHQRETDSLENVTPAVSQHETPQ